MSDNLWNEVLILKRYHLSNYKLINTCNPSFYTYLKNMYKKYNKDLKCDFITLPIQSNVELEAQNTQLNYKEYLLDDVLSKRILQLMKIFSKCPRNISGKGDYLKRKEKLLLDNCKKVEKYTKLFKKMSDQMFKKYLKFKFSISALDTLILSLEIENFFQFQYLLCLVAAFFQFILFHYSKNTNFIISPNAKPLKVKYKTI